MKTRLLFITLLSTIKRYLLILLLLAPICFYTQGQEVQADTIRVCQFCNGTGFVSCNKCIGTGKVMCITCGGGGTKSCHRCGGSGQIFSYDALSKSNKYTPCTSCGGSGRSGCTRCQRSGHVVCTFCGGNGRIKCLHCRSNKK